MHKGEDSDILPHIAPDSPLPPGSTLEDTSPAAGGGVSRPSGGTDDIPSYSVGSVRTSNIVIIDDERQEIWPLMEAALNRIEQTILGQLRAQEILLKNVLAAVPSHVPLSVSTNKEISLESHGHTGLPHLSDKYAGICSPQRNFSSVTSKPSEKSVVETVSDSPRSHAHHYSPWVEDQPSSAIGHDQDSVGETTTNGSWPPDLDPPLRLPLDTINVLPGSIREEPAAHSDNKNCHEGRGYAQPIEGSVKHPTGCRLFFRGSLTTMLVALFKEQTPHRSTNESSSRRLSRCGSGQFKNRESPLSRLIQSTTFTSACAFLVLMNSIFIGYQADLDVHSELLRLRGESIKGNWTLQWIDRAFCFLFLIELVLRVAALKRTFFIGDEWPWNLFDFILVLSAILEILGEVAGMRSGPNLTSARILRVVRVIRTLRVLRVVRVFQSLRWMVLAIVNSIMSLLWVFLLMVLVIYLFGIIFLHGVINHFEAAEPGDTQLTSLIRRYGSLSEVLLSLFMAIAGGVDWDELARPLLQLNSFYLVLFALYVAFMIFGVCNVVTGVFVDTACQISQKDREVLVQEELQNKETYMNNLKEILYEADIDESGTLSREEFERYLDDQRVRAYLRTMELDISEAHGLFNILDIHGTGEIDIEDLAMGCMRLKGSAKSMDVCILLFEHRRQAKRWANFSNYVVDQFKRMEKAMHLAPLAPNCCSSTCGSNWDMQRSSRIGNSQDLSRIVGSQDLSRMAACGAPVSAQSSFRSATAPFMSHFHSNPCSKSPSCIQGRPTDDEPGNSYLALPRSAASYGIKEPTKDSSAVLSVKGVEGRNSCPDHLLLSCEPRAPPGTIPC